jgi:SAM-dependent methyltransferase
VRATIARELHLIDRLRAKPGADRVHVVQGDLADVPVDGEFSLITCVDNTLFLLESQDEQVRCFANAARRLGEDGVLVVEVPARVPKMDEDEQGVFVEHVGPDRVGLWIVDHDRAGQRMFMQQVSFENGSVRLLPVPVRYAWPAELDLMARMAGLRLRERWSGWNGEPFTSSMFNYSGGMGARAEKDGLSAICYPTGVAAVPVEVLGETDVGVEPARGHLKSAVGRPDGGAAEDQCGPDSVGVRRFRHRSLLGP